MLKSNTFVTVLGMAFFSAIVLLILAAVGGWCMNIYQLFGCDFTEINNKELLKILGVPFVPIGVVMGWIG